MEQGWVKYVFVFISAFFVPLLPLASQEADSIRHYKLDRSVVTSSVAKKPVRSLMTGNITLDVTELDWLPQILGTPDLLKTLQLMPGVTASGEMDAGVYVRGADPGQVSVLFDGAKIYFPSHLLNFYSVFNSDHLASATILKSDISASYGGGALGVIDVKSPDTVARKFGGKVNVGLISSQATLDVPLGKKSSFRVSGRGTYVNFLLKGISSSMNAVQPEYGFYDANLTWVYRPDENNLIKLNTYYSKDDLAVKMGGMSIDGDMDWHNMVSSLNWNRIFDNDMKMNNAVSMSEYSNVVRMFREDMNIILPAGIMDLSYNGNLSMPWGRGSLKVGVDYVYHRTRIQTPQVSGLFGLDMSPAGNLKHTHEFAAYAEYSKWFSFPLLLNVGLRFGGAVTDGIMYKGLEPRISLSYDLKKNMRLRASAMRQMQYVNTVSVSGIGLPTDFLVPVCSSIKPQIVSTASIGFSHSFCGNMYEYSVEPYISRLYNVLEFDGDMFDLFRGGYFALDHILSGDGLNYGVEFMLKKDMGKVNGWISYTFSRSLRIFPAIKEGMAFSSKHDRPHNLSCVLNYCPSERWMFSSVFVYGTGTPYTQPLGLSIIGGSLIEEYGDHNGARMPDYHRLDLSATYRFPQKGRCAHSINCSVYNVYARHNPMMRNIVVGYDEENMTLNLRLVGVRLYTILPSISYNLSF